MKKMGLNEIREAFLSFYQGKEHYRRQSFPLIPQNDKSLLLINAGMAPLKPYFAGIETPPAPRMTTCQKCIRTADIENVGITARHGTFFEMLGNFSFGDYFKHESIKWGWEFVTEVLEMPPEKIWPSVHEDDDEAYNIWKDEIGIPEERIVRLGKDDNFWEIGAGPCGPCSELYFDRGEQYGCDNPDCKPGCDCDRYVEFWNHVFTQYNNDGEGNYTELSQKNIDTGMGLERVACIMQGTDSIFDIDTIRYILQEVEKATGSKYENGSGKNDVSIRIITDHLRSATFMIGDKIMPSNEGRGYVLRRIIRRAVRHGRKLGVKKAFLSELVDSVVAVSGDAYPEIKTQQVFIKKIIDTEEKKFAETLEQGMAIIEDYIEDMKLADEIVLSGDKAFKLHDTYGFPIDITEEILAETGYGVDREGFEECMKQQKNAGKADAAETDAAWEDFSFADFSDSETEFTGYETSADSGKVLAVIKNKQEVSELSVDDLARDPSDKDEVYIILDKTPFYAEMGGQISDTGIISGDDFEAEVISVEKSQNVFAHKVIITKGTARKGDTVKLSVNIIQKYSSARNHTATHLLHAALREVLGEHVQQAGSLVTDNSLRFDFNHFESVSSKDLKKIEFIVNEKINSFLPVNTNEMSLDDAKQCGAIGLFEDKYGSKVRVVSAGDYSRELCGGIHVKNTGEIGAFHIVSENGVAAGVRRIEAITGAAVLQKLKDSEKIIKQTAEKLKANEDQIINRLDTVLRESKETAKELEEFKKQAMGSQSDSLYDEAQEINGIKLIAEKFEGYSVDDLRNISDEIKANHKSAALVLAAVNGSKLNFIVSLTDDVVEKGFNAGKMIKQIAAAAGGGGGGKADMAQAGAKDASKVDDAFKVAEDLLRN